MTHTTPGVSANPNADPSIFSPEIESACASLSQLYARGVVRATADPACWADESFDRTSMPAFLQRYDTPMQRWPVIIGHAQHARLGKTAADLATLVLQIPSRFFGNDPEHIRNYFRLTEDRLLERVFMEPTGLQYAMARADFALTPSGPRLLEFNMGPGIGGWEIYLFERCYRIDHPVVAAFQEPGVELSTLQPMRLLLRHAFSAGHRHFAGRQQESTVNVGIAVPGSFADAARELIRERLAVGQMQARQSSLPRGQVVCFSQASDIDDRGSEVLIDGCAVHVVVDLTEDTAIQSRFMGAFKRASLLLLNGPAPVVLGSKCALALLSECAERGLLAPEEKSLIDAAVPWTRKVEENVEADFKGERGSMGEVLLRCQSDLVLKPDDDRNGNSVTIGARVARSTWAAEVDRALQSGHFIAQEYCPSLPFLAPFRGEVRRHDLVWSVFVLGGTFGGSWVRMMPSSDAAGVINCYRGASEAIVFEHR